MKIINSATRIVLILIVLSIIILNFMQIEVWEPLKSMAICVISFYFWQKWYTKDYIEQENK